MTRKPPSTPQELVDLFLRRRIWILLPALVIPVLVFAASLMLPKMYESETVVLVDPQKIPAEYVKAAVASDISERLQTIKEEVMSRTRLQLIADELGLYPAVRQKNDKAKVIAAMQQDITVTLIKGAGEHNTIDGFKIGYLAGNPRLAQQVTQRIADLFIAENLKVRARESEGTNDFISDQLTKARTELEAQEARIKEFKAAHMGSLPEQESSNLSLVSQYQSLAQANSESIDRANQQRVYLESMLNVTGGGTPKAGSSAEPGPLQLQLSAKQAELEADRQKYTEAYPDVVRLKSEIAELQQQIRAGGPGARATASGAGPASTQVPGAGPSVTRQLEGQLASIQQEIKLRTARQEQLEAQMHGLQGNISMLPATQQEFADLNRDYQAMQLNYASLQEKQQASGMATELERHNDSESFRILDPASLPSSPTSPNLLLINAGGIAAGLFFGVALGLLLDLRDATIHNPEDLQHYLDLPLIVAVPSLTGATVVGSRGKARSRRAAADRTDDRAHA